MKGVNRLGFAHDGTKLGVTQSERNPLLRKQGLRLFTPNVSTPGRLTNRVIHYY